MKFLATPESGYSEAVAINNVGQVIGRTGANFGFGSPQSFYNGTIWQDDTVTHLPSLTFTAINDVGKVVGYGTAGTFIWDGISMSQFANTPQSSDYALTINNAGVVAGYGADPTNPGLFVVATIWNGQNTTRFGTFGGPSSSINDLNNLGNAAGMSSAAPWQGRAAKWIDGVVTDLHPDGWYDSSAASINDEGLVVGWARSDAFRSQAMIWHGTVATQLATIEGFGSSGASDINVHGQVVGSVSNGRESRAVLWANGEIVDLNSFLDIASKEAGWYLAYATSINDHGMIVGVAQNVNGPIGSFGARAFLLSPVPETPTLVLLLAGLVFIAWKSNRRSRVAALC